jgi:signal peptidase I
VSDDSEPARLSWKTPLIRVRVLLNTLLIAILCYGFFTWVLWPVKVTGRSMTPTFPDGSRHFINKLAYWSAKPQRGDVVALRADDGDVYLKRIVGLPGEVISFEEGILHVNGVPMRETYTNTKVPLPWREPVELGKEECYAIGDNRAITVLGAIPTTRIIGKVAF